MIPTISDPVWQSIIAAVVTILLALIQRNAQKIDKLTTLAKSTHLLVNSNFGTQLKIAALALRRIANTEPRNLEDEKAAQVAEAALTEHVKAQAEADNNTAKEKS